MGGTSGAGHVVAFLGGAAVVAGVLGAMTAMSLGALGAKFLPELPPPCPVDVVAPAPLSGLRVNVYNAANTEGLATRTADSLRAHGVDVVSLGNKEVPKFAAKGPDVIITASAAKLGEAAALQALFPGSSFLLDDDEPAVSAYLAKADPNLGGKPSTAKGTLRCASG